VGAPTALPPCHWQLCNTQLANCSLTPRRHTAPPAAAAPVDSGTHFPDFRLASPGSSTGHLRTKGPPCHGGREIREAPPSPPGGQNPVGWGRGCLSGPLHPSSVCTPIPQSPGGERLDSSQAVMCQHAQLHARKFTAQAPPARLDLTPSGRSTPGRQHLGDQAAIPAKTYLPGPTTWSVSENYLVAGTWLTSVLGHRPRSLPMGMQSLLRMCACSCLMYLYVCHSLKAT
jgi:hypothetical protein